MSDFANLKHYLFAIKPQADGISKIHRVGSFSIKRNWRLPVIGKRRGATSFSEY